jgi:hypothetical protein
VQSNLPLPKLNEVYYWESKIYEKAPGCTIAIGLATKPFPSFRLPGTSSTASSSALQLTYPRPGWSKYSVGYFSSDGFKSHSYPFTSQSYGPPLTTGDVLGVGYRPRTGTVFFTRNGRKLEDAFIGLNKHNLFPTVGANGACSVHVNFGQAGFVFIEANVKKWGLAPMMGTLAPPPAYGSERGSILLETAGAGSSAALPPPVISETRPSTSAQRGGPQSRHRNRRPVVAALASNSAGAVSALSSPSQPIRPSPLRHSRQASTQSSYSSLSNRGDDSEGHGGEAENPPTPGLGAISLHSIHRFPTLERSDEEDEDTPSPSSGSPRRGTSDSGSDSGGEVHALIPAAPVEASVRNASRSPPAYHPIDPHVCPSLSIPSKIPTDVIVRIHSATHPESQSCSSKTPSPPLPTPANSDPTYLSSLNRTPASHPSQAPRIRALDLPLDPLPSVQAVGRHTRLEQRVREQAGGAAGDSASQGSLRAPRRRVEPLHRLRERDRQEVRGSDVHWWVPMCCRFRVFVCCALQL